MSAKELEVLRIQEELEALRNQQQQQTASSTAPAVTILSYSR